MQFLLGKKTGSGKKSESTGNSFIKSEASEDDERIFHSKTLFHLQKKQDWQKIKYDGYY